MSRIIDGKNGLRAGRNFFGDFAGIEVQRVGRDVGEHRRRALIQNAVGGGAERHGSSDRFVPRPQSGGKRRAVQGGRAGTETDCVPRSDPDREPLFELADLRPRGQPVRLQNLNHRLDISVIQALPPVRQELSTHRRTTVDGKRFQFCGQGTHVSSP